MHSPRNRGQILLEYVLLMLIAISVATLIRTKLTAGSDTDPQDMGVLRKQWYLILKTIGDDKQN